MRSIQGIRETNRKILHGLPTLSPTMGGRRQEILRGIVEEIRRVSSAARIGENFVIKIKITWILDTLYD